MSHDSTQEVESPDTRKKARGERNRAAAQASRDRKKQHVADQQKKIDQLTAANEALAKQVQELQKSQAPVPPPVQNPVATWLSKTSGQPLLSPPLTNAELESELGTFASRIITPARTPSPEPEERALYLTDAMREDEIGAMIDGTYRAASAPAEGLMHVSYGDLEPHVLATTRHASTSPVRLTADETALFDAFLNTHYQSGVAP